MLLSCKPWTPQNRNEFVRRQSMCQISQCLLLRDNFLNTSLATQLRPHMPASYYVTETFSPPHCFTLFGCVTRRKDLVSTAFYCSKLEDSKQKQTQKFQRTTGYCVPKSPSTHSTQMRVDSFSGSSGMQLADFPLLKLQTACFNPVVSKLFSLRLPIHKNDFK